MAVKKWCPVVLIIMSTFLVELAGAQTLGLYDTVTLQSRAHPELN